jgi:catechol 2,3-dioxygenase-like lactoylglutathione lyase family enzyme
MLRDSKVMAFAPTTNQDRAIAFYRDGLGLQLLGQDGFAATFDALGAVLRVTSVPSPFTPQPFTILGWHVTDIAASIRALHSAGVVFERFPNIGQDELGIWTAPGGAARVAWFKDPDGNILSLTQS